MYRIFLGFLLFVEISLNNINQNIEAGKGEAASEKNHRLAVCADEIS